MGRAFGGDAALMQFVQRAVDYTLTGETTEQALLVLKGAGANGKSTFLSVLRSLLGEYALAAALASFLDGLTSIRNNLARLSGARLVSASEPERGRPLAESLVKQLTGGGTHHLPVPLRRVLRVCPELQALAVREQTPADHLRGRGLVAAFEGRAV